jgi:hypothetical protein
MNLMLLPSRAGAPGRPLMPATHLRRAGVVVRPAASSSNVEVVDTAAASNPPQEWRAGRHGLELDLSEDMRRGMMWRMLASPAAAVAADAAFLRLLDGAAPGNVPAWAAAAGSAVLFAVGLLGVHYGFLSSRWDATEKGSALGWDLAVRHWNVMSMAREDDEEYEDDEDEYEDDVEE